MHSRSTTANLTQTGVIGTMGYIAPEILDGVGYGRTEDQYSLAVVVHDSFHTGRIENTTSASEGVSRIGKWMIVASSPKATAAHHIGS